MVAQLIFFVKLIRVFSPPICTSDFPINQIRLLFNQYHLPYFTAIDAVALLGTFEPATSGIFSNVIFMALCNSVIIFWNTCAIRIRNTFYFRGKIVIFSA